MGGYSNSKKQIEFLAESYENIKMTLCKECTGKSDPFRKVTVVYTRECEACGKPIKEAIR